MQLSEGDPAHARLSAEPADRAPAEHDAAVAIRVVTVDDNDDMRMMLRLATEQRSDVRIVAEARDGAEAIQVAAAYRPDLLVLDVNMPVMDGISALPGLRVVSPDTRVVMLSALDEPAARERALAAGAVAYLSKSTPVTSLVDDLLRVAALLDSVLVALGERRLVDPRADDDSPGRARRFVADTLRTKAEHDVVSTVQLLVSELVTNVVLHTSAAPEVTVRLLLDRVHVEVRDDAPVIPVPRQATPNATSGRGMALIDQLSVDWGTTPTASGKIVWFDVAR